MVRRNDTYGGAVRQVPGIQGGFERCAGQTGNPKGIEAAGLEDDGYRAFVREVGGVEVGDILKIKTARDDDQRRSRHSGVAYKRGRIVYMNRPNGWVCIDFGYYRACAYIRDIRNKVVIVV